VQQEEVFLAVCAAHVGGDAKRMPLHVFQNTVFATGMAAMTEEAAAIAFAVSRPMDETTLSFLQYTRALACMCKSVDELVSLVAQVREHPNVFRLNPTRILPLSPSVHPTHTLIAP